MSNNNSNKPALRPVTFTPEALKAVIAEAVAIAMANKKADNRQAGFAGKTERSLKNEIKTVRAFKKAGFGNVKPHEDVLTFNRWIAKGFRPAEGSKSVKVGNLRLFHKSQVRQITAEEKMELNARNKEAIQRHNSQNAPEHTTTLVD
jgi:hypothetical protein